MHIGDLDNVITTRPKTERIGLSVMTLELIKYLYTVIKSLNHMTVFTRKTEKYNNKKTVSYLFTCSDTCRPMKRTIIVLFIYIYLGYIAVCGEILPCAVSQSDVISRERYGYFQYLI